MPRAVGALALVAVVVAACSSGANKKAETNTPPAGTATTRRQTAASGWPTYHHDAARTGVADDQAALGQPAKVWQSAALDGAVYAQPLVAGDKVVAATEANSVYALDPASGRQSWRAPLGQAVSGDSLPCGNIDPSGITGTPVADPATSTLYVVAFLAAGPHHELFALDLATGAVRWHRAIDPPGLSPRVEQERGALALTGGRVLVPYGGLLGDCGAYKGAVVSAAADGTGDLSSYVVPAGREAGIWNPAGETVDATGDIWVNTGNSASQGAFDYGNAVVHVTAQLRGADFFAPREWARLNAGDTDLGSTSPVLVGETRIFAAGKSGIAYLLDRAHLGGIGGALTQADVCDSAFGQPAVQSTVVFLPCVDGLVAVRTDGDKLTRVWRHDGRAGPPIVAAGAVWVLDGSGRVSALDPTNGTERYRTQIGEPVSRFVSMAAAGGRLFVPAVDHIIALSLR